MIYRYIYIVTCRRGSFKNKYYIGQHTTKNLNDGYKGSGTLIRKYYKKYHSKDDYFMSIVCFCNSQEELDYKEKEILKTCLDDEDCLNIAKGGKNYIGIDWRYNMSEEKYKRHCENISKSLKGHKGAIPFVNMTEEQKTQWRLKLSQKGKGKKKTQQQIEKLKKAMHNRYLGYRFMTDGYNVVLIPSDLWGEYIDIGYKFGKNKFLLQH